MTPGRILVVTVVHHPDDARIRHRQIASLLSAGWQVTYAAPWDGYGLEPPPDVPGLTPVDITRAQGRRRLAAQRDARRVLRGHGPDHDVVLLHDPELIPATVGMPLPPVVWDVHEDTRAVIALRSWIPDAVRRPLASLGSFVERRAERRMGLLLADHEYAERFAQVHQVVPNTTPVPIDPPDAGRPDGHGRLRAVYLGSITHERGVQELVAVGRALRERSEGRVCLEVIGPGHGPAADVLAEASAAGQVEWTGFLPAGQALGRLDGALAGLSLLHDVANFRPSMPTKVVEYLAHGIPVITTPLPRAVELVERSGAGVVVPFNDTEQTVEQLLRWARDPEEAAALGRRGHELALRELDWAQHAPSFVAEMARLAARRR